MIRLSSCLSIKIASMKLFFIAFSFLFCICLAGQSNVEITFTGTEMDSSEVQVKIYEHLTMGVQNTLMHFPKSKDNKIFKYTIDRDVILIININGSSHNLYVEPNDVLHVSLKGNGKLNVEGTREKENSVLHECFGSSIVIKFPKSKSESLKDKLIALEERSSFLDSVYLANQNDISLRFNKYLKATIAGFNYFILDSFLYGYEPETASDVDRSLYYSNLAKLDSLPIYEQEYSRLYMNSFYLHSYKIPQPELNLYTSTASRQQNLSAMAPRDSKLYNLGLATILNTAIYKSSTLEELKFAENQFYDFAHYFDLIPFTKQQLMKDLQYKRKKLSIKSISDQMLLNSEGDSLNAFEIDSKFLLVDFWASWCKPCIAGFEKIKTIKQKYPHLKVNMININDTNALWKESLYKYNLDYVDQNFFATNSESTSLMESLSFNFIPQYFLLNKSGEIIYTGTSPEELSSKIDEALN